MSKKNRETGTRVDANVQQIHHFDAIVVVGYQLQMQVSIITISMRVIIYGTFGRLEEASGGPSECPVTEGEAVFKDTVISQKTLEEEKSSGCWWRTMRTLMP